jgi:hypothetical protein
VLEDGIREVGRKKYRKLILKELRGGWMEVQMMDDK